MGIISEFLEDVSDIMTPERVFGHEDLQWLEITRITLSLVFAAFVTVQYTGLSGDVLINALWVSPVTNMMVAVPSVLVAMAVILVAAESARRREVLRDLWPPLARLLILIGSTAGVLAFYTLLAPAVFRSLDLGFVQVVGAIVFGIAIISALAVIIPVLGWAWILGVRHWFTIGDSHPMLPALCTAVLACGQLAINIIAGGKGAAELPLWATLAVSVGGPLGIMAFCATELTILRRRGVSLGATPTRRL